MSALLEFIRMWYEQVINSTWLMAILLPITECLDTMWRAFIGGGNDRKEEQDN